MKAGQLSRHSCNQILRGRYQHTRVQAGPEHKQDHSRGREGRQDRDRNHNKGGQTTKGTRARTSTARSAKKPERRRGETAGAQRQHNPTSPTGQHKQGSTRQPKRMRAAQTKQVKSKVRLTEVRQEAKRRQNEGGGACS